ncbi:MAG: hypothetical protein ABIP94_04410 [Planctomycetota bacterium]
MPNHMRLSPVILFVGMLVTAASLPAQLGGTYVVGPAATYSNIAAAIAALTTSGVAAPVTFLVTANDTGPWTIPAFPGQGPANPVLFDTIAPVTIGGAAPMLTLNGCASVTFRGFNGTFPSAASSFVVDGGATDCAFANCNFVAPTSTGGAALFRFINCSGCRIEDSTFGGAYEALKSEVGDSNATVQRCRILGGGWRILTMGGTNFTLANNFITGNTPYGINAGIPGMPTSGANLKIWHNSVYIVHTGSGTQLCSLRWYSGAAGTEVIDNVFYDDLSTLSFNMWCSGTLRPVLMNNNCFWSNLAGYFPVWASTNQTLAQWQALGFDGNSIQANPMFVAPTATPPDLSLQVGSPCTASGVSLPFVVTDFFLTPRTTPVSIGAHEQDSGIGATYAIFGPGCPGTAGVPSNTISAPPRLGQSSVITFGNLPPPVVAFAIVGLSSTVSAFGPLPLNLAPLGIPGCQGRVSPDVLLGLVGASGSATLPFTTPNQIGLLGFTFFTQALVIDPTLNAFGASISDAAVGVVGL